ncbi:endonuclease MutS2 [Pasteuria penetrans]|uniref:endonuclease MutS2 n=1 Tax=Pasteuria penetrans TaxID=86005 RepID=UPI000F9C179B|nr:endonuclease MutS2 [Pasteuria penetrans]
MEEIWSLASLEYQAVQQRIRVGAETPAGTEMIDKLLPSARYEEVVERLAITEEAIHVMRRTGGLSLQGVPELGEILLRARVGGILSAPQLLGILRALVIADCAKRIIEKAESKTNPWPHMRYLLASFAHLPVLVEDLQRSVDDKGEICDQASADLARIRRRLRDSREAIRSQLQRFLHDPQNKALLQEPLVTVRNGRYCIPVKQSLQQAVPGIVHDRSSSGATVFVEPTGVVEKNNYLSELMKEEEVETERILRVLSAAVASEYEVLRIHTAALAELDVRLALARFARQQHAVCPKITQGWQLDLKGVFHPLLSRTRAVPIDLRLDEGRRGLVITGPNTGGKTVALKTLGLCTLMVQAGIPIPAREESVMPVYRCILADIGDEQSITQNLSTFSGHLKHILHILKIVKSPQGDREQPALLLLDELGSGTDPAEGAALAAALLEKLLSYGGHLLVSTHFEVLKLFAHGHSRLQNAGMEFDRKTLAPTFRLRVGMPGKSHALTIARRLGLDKETLERARFHLANTDCQMKDVLAALDEEQQRAKAERLKAESLRQQAMQERDQLRGERDRWIKEQVSLRAKAEQRATELVQQTEQEAERLLDGLRTRLSRLEKGQALSDDFPLEHQVSEAKCRLRQTAGWNDDSPFTPVVRDGQQSLRVGDKVLVKNLNREGRVVKIERGNRLQVEVGRMRMSVSSAQVERLWGDKTQKKTPSRRGDRPPSIPTPSFKVERKVLTEVNLRGMRVEEVLYELDAYLDAAILARHKQVTVIHGKGTGTLRRVIHEFLSSHRSVHRFRLGRQGEGDTGVTVVELS